MSKGNMDPARGIRANNMIKSEAFNNDRMPVDSKFKLATQYEPRHTYDNTGEELQRQLDASIRQRNIKRGHGRYKIKGGLLSRCTYVLT